MRNPARKKRATSTKWRLKWVPVEERVPDNDRDVIVTIGSPLSGTCTRSDWYATSRKCFSTYGACVIAWAELPPPYTPKRRGK